MAARYLHPPSPGHGDMLDLMYEAADVDRRAARLKSYWTPMTPTRTRSSISTNQSHIFAGALWNRRCRTRLARFAERWNAAGNGLAVLSGYGATEAASTMCLYRRA